jgi:hypothetical protein
MGDEQLGFDLDYDEKTRAYLEWVAPEHMEAQVEKFLAATVGDVPAEGAGTWWNPPFSTRVMEATVRLFGDWESFIAPENHELADGFIRFLGECFIRRYDDITWTNRREWGAPLYDDIGPGVQVRDTHAFDMVSEAEQLFMEDYGPRMVEYIISNAHRQVW